MQDKLNSYKISFLICENLCHLCLRKLALQSGAKQKALSAIMGSRHPLQSLVPNPGTKGFPLLSGLKDFQWDSF